MQRVGHLIALLICWLTATGCTLLPGNPDAALCPENLSAEQWSLVLDAAEEWNVASDGRVTLHPGCPGDLAMIGVRGLTGELEDGSVGKVNGRTDLQGTYIKLETERPAFKFRRTVLHELGHYLTGVEHSDDPDDVMFPSCSVEHLTAADIARLPD